MTVTDEQKNVLLGAAIVEGLTYAVLVYLAASFTSWPIDFRPSVGKGEMYAIGSMIAPLLAIFIFAKVHKMLQSALCKYGPKPTGLVRAIDIATSLLPGLALAIALLADWIGKPTGGYYNWSLGYLLFIALMVADSIVEDIRALGRYG